MQRREVSGDLLPMMNGLACPFLGAETFEDIWLLEKVANHQRSACASK